MADAAGFLAAGAWRDGGGWAFEKGRQGRPWEWVRESNMGKDVGKSDEDMPEGFLRNLDFSDIQPENHTKSANQKIVSCKFVSIHQLKKQKLLMNN